MMLEDLNQERTKRELTRWLKMCLGSRHTEGENGRRSIDSLKIERWIIHNGGYRKLGYFDWIGRFFKDI